MNKIILKSLELAGFKNASEIAKVISATPNPTVATEIVLGIYEPKTVAELGEYWKPRYDEAFYQVLSIDELHDIVTCTKFTQKTEPFYYLTSEDYNSKTNRVAKADKKDGVKYYDWRHEHVPGYETKTETFKLEAFNDSLKRTDVYAVSDMLVKWDPMQEMPEPEMVDLQDNVLF